MGKFKMQSPKSKENPSSTPQAQRWGGWGWFEGAGREDQ
jgi:hypothetical protein